MSEFSKLNERLKPYVEDYDSWLLAQADAYMDPDISEVEVKGVSYFDVNAKKPDGTIVSLKNIPLQVFCDVDVTDEDERTGRCYPVKWDTAEERAEDRFDIGNLNNYDTFVEELPDEELLPEDYELVEVIGFSDGHSFDDLEIE